MVFFSTPHDDELARSESSYYQNHQDTMPSLRRPVQTVSPGSTTSAVPQARRFPSPGRMRTGNSPNVGTAADTFGFPADMSSYYNMSMDPHNLNNYMNLNVPSNGHLPYHREAATAAQWHHSTPSFPINENYAQVNNVPWPQNPSAYTHPVATSELQSSSGYGDHFHTPPSFHGPQSQGTAQEFWYGQYPNGYAPYSPEFSPSTDGPSSSYPGPSSYHELSSYYRDPSSYPESSAHYVEAYHGSWPQWHNSAIGDPQPAGPSLPEYPAPSMTPLPPHAAFSQPYINHGGDMDYRSYRPPSTQPREDLPRHDSGSRQSSQSQRHRFHRGSHTQETHRSPSTRFSCAWIVGSDNRTCGFEGPLGAFKTHFRSTHLSGPQDSPTECYWRGCKYRRRGNPNEKLMRRDSAWRHVWETHLRMRRGN